MAWDSADSESESESEKSLLDTITILHKYNTHRADQKLVITLAKRLPRLNSSVLKIHGCPISVY